MRSEKPQSINYQLPTGGGFTLLEVLIYSLILAIFLGAALAFIATIFSSTDVLLERNEVIVNQEFIERKISRFAPFATAIIIPAANSSSTQQLRLTVVNPTLNPVFFSYGDQKLTLSTGGGAAVPLVNNRVRVSQFLVEHLATTSAPAILKIQLELKDNIYPHLVSTTTLSYVLP